MSSTSEVQSAGTGGRLLSLDALRGFDMIWIMGRATVVRIAAGYLPDGPGSWIALQMKHAPWGGFSFYDLIFPLFLFMAGISWPKEMIPDAWWYIACCIPYTHGAHAFIHINSMGATLTATATEYIALWILTSVYFVLACGLFYIRKKRLFEESILETEEVEDAVQTDR